MSVVMPKEFGLTSYVSIKIYHSVDLLSTSNMMT